MRVFTLDDLLSLELTVEREGVLDRQNALDLIAEARTGIEEQKIEEAWYAGGYQDGFADALAQVRNGEA